MRVLLLEGAAGVGKTHLVEAALQAAADDLTILVGRGDDLEQARPFGPLIGALLATDADGVMRDELVRLLRDDVTMRSGRAGSPEDPGLPYRLVDGFVELVEAIALDGPLVLFLDDLQWADASTLVTVNSLARRLGYLDISILATFRPLPRGVDLSRLLDALLRRGADDLILEPLDDRAALDLAEQLAGAPPGPALSSAAAQAGGNPLYITELLASLQAEGLIEVLDGGRAEVAQVSIPPSLRLTIRRRLAFLGPDAFDVLQQASVLGATFSVRDVATLLQRPITELVRILQAPIRAGLLREANDRLRFRHDLIREAIYADLPEDVRRALHREAGRRLAAAGAPALQCAEHLVLGAQHGDTEAIGWLHTAARTSGQQAPSTAVRLLERALELGPPDDLRAPIIADLVPTLLSSGRPKDAEAQAQEALAQKPPRTLEGGLRLGLVRALSAQGRHTDLIDEVDGTLADDADVEPEVRSQLLAEAGNAHLLLGAFDDAEAAARDAVTVGSPMHGDGAEAGLLVLAEVARGRGDLQASLAHAEDALRRAEQRKGTRLGWRPEIFVAMALRSLDRFEEADEAIQQGRDRDERLGNVSYLPVYDYEEATGRFLAGHWDEATQRAQTGLALAEEVGLSTMRTWPTGLLALIAVHRGDLDAADDWLATAVERAGASRELTGRCLLAWALRQEAAGDPAAALATLRAYWDRSHRQGLVAAAAAIGPELVRLALAMDDRTGLARIVSALEVAATRATVPSLKGAALRCRGLVDSDPDLLLRSVEAYRAGPRHFERAQACGDAGVALMRSGREKAAAGLFDEALDTLEEIGAARAEARVLATMRALGIRSRQRRGARARPAHGWDALTPSELEVVRLAADGLTNPEIGQRLFVSRRTVQTHLYHAFQKLDVRSRVELAAAVARRGGIPDTPTATH